MKIGAKLKLLRLQCGLTQSELANRCDLTKGYISQLEHDFTSPSIATLVDLLQALGTNLQAFFRESQNEQIVFKNEDYFEKVFPEQKTTWLVPNAQKNMMEPIIMEISPKNKVLQDMPHDGEEFGYVLEGSITLIYDYNMYKLKKGDSFYFVADKVHSIENNTNSIAKIMWISTPPSF